MFPLVFCLFLIWFISVFRVSLPIYFLCFPCVSPIFPSHLFCPCSHHFLFQILHLTISFSLPLLSKKSLNQGHPQENVDSTSMLFVSILTQRQNTTSQNNFSPQIVRIFFFSHSQYQNLLQVSSGIYKTEAATCRCSIQNN